MSLVPLHAHEQQLIQHKSTQLLASAGTLVPSTMTRPPTPPPSLLVTHQLLSAPSLPPLDLDAPVGLHQLLVADIVRQQRADLLTLLQLDEERGAEMAGLKGEVEVMRTQMKAAEEAVAGLRSINELQSAALVNANTSREETEVSRATAVKERDHYRAQCERVTAEKQESDRRHAQKLQDLDTHQRLQHERKMKEVRAELEEDRQAMRAEQQALRQEQRKMQVEREQFNKAKAAEHDRAADDHDQAIVIKTLKRQLEQTNKEMERVKRRADDATHTAEQRKAELERLRRDARQRQESEEDDDHHHHTNHSSTKRH